MCGRYTLTIDIKTVAEKFGVPASLDTSPRYNIAPTQEVVSVMRNGESHLAWLRWGLIPSWAKDESIGSRMINARAETLTEKPSFKGLLRSKRCLIVADGFYEWKQENGSKTPMYIALKSGEPFAFAGLWDLWKSPGGEHIRSCTIITTEPNDLVASIHNRMPAILSPGAYAAWLDPDIRDEQALSHWLAPYPAEEMMARPVSRLVNDPKHDSPELIA
ncbi:MAG TPA: SOS response-associated peptidase [Ktedonobacteraceae bacterium]|nr:SOS response-associated peptidase [Ktedonobacteraceae bacterium]